MPASLFLICLLTFVHYAAAQMRSPIIPLYAVSHGATATAVGLIVGAHMLTAAVASIPFGRAADMWGRRRFLLARIGIPAGMSVLRPTEPIPCPGDRADGRSLGGGDKEHRGVGGLEPGGERPAGPRCRLHVPPAGWVIDRFGQRLPYAFGGVAIAAVLTVLVPHIGGLGALLGLVALFGTVSGVAFVAISVELTGAAPPACRGLVMGGYSTALYLGLTAGSLALGPVITGHGYPTGFAVGGALGGLGALLAAVLRAHRREPWVL